MKITFDIPDNTIGAVLSFMVGDENGVLGIGTQQVCGDKLHDGAVLVWDTPASDDVQATIDDLNHDKDIEIVELKDELEQLKKSLSGRFRFLENERLRNELEAVKRENERLHKENFWLNSVEGGLNDV